MMLLEIVAFLLSCLFVICVWLIIECNRIVNRYEYLAFLLKNTNSLLDEMRDEMRGDV